MLNKIYQAAIITGTGIKEDGSLPASSQRNIDKVVDLYKAGIVPRIIFSGKWAWNISFTPPLTEAEGMKQQAVARGVPDKAILIETDSVTTVSNMCLVKRKILIPNNWTNVVFVVPHEILIPRYRVNVENVLGPDYHFDILSSDTEYTQETLIKLKATEPGKLQDAVAFYTDMIPGDHEAIYSKAMEDLKVNYISKK